MKEIELLQEMIDASSHIVFFSGAGVSTASGIKDFRSKDGLYQEKFKYPPEYMLSAACFDEHPEDFFQFYKSKLNCLEARPNVTHMYLKKLEDAGKLSAVVTQNIDGLHGKAEVSCVYELHGTIYENYCEKCHQFYPAEIVFECEGIPKCHCGGTIKPNVVLYGEMLPEDAYNGAVLNISKADLLIVAGTSLLVEPASSLVRCFQGKHLVIVNLDETPYDSQADLVIHANLEDVFRQLKV